MRHPRRSRSNGDSAGQRRAHCGGAPVEESSGASPRAPKGTAQAAPGRDQRLYRAARAPRKAGPGTRVLHVEMGMIRRAWQTQSRRHGSTSAPAFTPGWPGPCAVARTPFCPSPYWAGTVGAPHVPWNGRATVKRTFAALLSCAALVTASVGTPPPTAQADVIADWNMQLVVMDTSWTELITTNFLTCKDLALYVQVSVQPGVQWSVSGEIMGVGSTTVLGSFAANGIGPTTYPQPPGSRVCRCASTLAGPSRRQTTSTWPRPPHWSPRAPRRNRASRIGSPSGRSAATWQAPCMNCATA